MKRVTILHNLHVDNEVLNLILSDYFIDFARLTEPVLGTYTFQDIYSDFKFCLREYAIDNIDSIDPSKNPTQEELLRLAKISSSELDEFIFNVNKLLKNYTDESWVHQKQKDTLRKQIFECIPNDPHKDTEPTAYKIIDSISSDDEVQDRYLNRILQSMKSAEVHQIKENKYLVIDALFSIQPSLDSTINISQYKEKKKYLIKIKNEEQRKHLLIKYLKKIISSHHNTEDALKEVQVFLFYLIYNSNQTHIYLIHSILGYKYKEGVKLYQQLFLKDHTTGTNDDFLLHTDVFSANHLHLEAGHEFDLLVNTVLQYIK